MIPPNINVNSKIENLNRRLIGDIITEFSEKKAHLFKRSVFNFMVKKQKETFKGKNKLHGRMRLDTPGGQYMATAEGWNEENVTKHALRKIEKQVDKRLRTKNKTRKKNFKSAPQDTASSQSTENITLKTISGFTKEELK